MENYFLHNRHEWNDITQHITGNDMSVALEGDILHFKFHPQPRMGWCYSEFEKIVNDATNNRFSLSFAGVFDEFDNNQHEIHICILLEEK